MSDYREIHFKYFNHSLIIFIITGIPWFTLLMWGHIKKPHRKWKPPNLRVLNGTKRKEYMVKLYTALNQKLRKSKLQKSRNVYIEKLEKWKLSFTTGVNKISLVIHEMIPFEALQLSIVQKFLRLVNGNKRLEQDILVIYHKWSML